MKSEKLSSKITKIEQVLEFCNKIVYLQTWNGKYIEHKIEHKI